MTLAIWETSLCSAPSGGGWQRRAQTQWVPLQSHLPDLCEHPPRADNKLWGNTGLNKETVARRVLTTGHSCKVILTKIWTSNFWEPWSLLQHFFPFIDS